MYAVYCTPFYSTINSISSQARRNYVQIYFRKILTLGLLACHEKNLPPKFQFQPE